MSCNVLFITADQWRGDTLGAVGHPLVQTPNLDRLASEGVLFRNHWTQAVPCGPARASLHTGMYLMNHRSVNQGTPLDRRFTNIALEARKAGYDPVLFGYTDISADPRGLPQHDPKLRTYEGLLPGITPVLKIADDIKPWLAHLQRHGYGRLTHENVFLPRPNYPGAENRGATFPPPIYAKEHSLAAFLTNAALGWLGTHEDEPWFAHLSYLPPHPPWSVSEPYNSMYDPESVPLPVRRESLEAEGSQHPVTQMLHEVLPRKEFFPNGDGPAAFADERDVLQARATYYGMMTEVDHNLGRLFDYLRESGQDERTLIVFTTDHGEQLGDHYLFDKRGYFDGGFHIPLIVRDPQAHGTRGHQIEAFTETIDTTPTILDWLGLEVPDQCDGVPLTPFLRGKTPERWRTEIHWEYDFREISSYQSQIQERFGLYPDQCSLAVLRDHRYKYVHCTALPPLLFDLQDDPHEFQNLADDPGCQPQVREYAQKMLSWMMNHRDRTLANISYKSGEMKHWKGPRY